MLDQEIKDKSKEIFTDSYAMSVGEIASMYKEEELQLQPDIKGFSDGLIPKKRNL